MLFNRLVDAGFDADNPRTKGRAVASGRLSRPRAWAMAWGAAGAFMVGCGAFLVLFDNPWPLILGGPVLAWLALYSLAKRFTALCHVLLGTALAISPVAAGLAVEPARALSATHLLVAGFVTLWVAGFDILYALQDEGFDKRAGLRSIPAALGAAASAWVARGLHAGASACLLALGLGVDARLGALTLVAWALATALLIVEHVVLVRRGLAGLPLAFFTLNGVLSLVVGGLGVADLLA
jgi:4-hydroxybenzoate polyprenyltransferase